VTSANLDANVAAIQSWLGWGPDDAGTTWLPLYHDMGLIGALLTPVASGSDLHLLTPDQFIRKPIRWLRALGELGATITTAPSFGYSYAARRVKPADIADMDFSRVRVAIMGAERIDPASMSRFTALAGPRGFDPGSLVAAYGLAESTLAVCGTKPGTRANLLRLELGSLRDGEPIDVVDTARLGDSGVDEGNWLTGCGKPVDGTTVHVVDENGAELPDGTVGEIRVRGTSVAHGYRSADPESATGFARDGLHTGDAGFIVDGELYVIGRIGDSIKVRGAKLYAEDLDAELGRLTGLPAGRNTALLGSVGGTDTVAVIVEDTGTPWLDAIAPALRAMVSDTTAIAVFRGGRTTVERTSSGKPRRRVLWRRLLDGQAPGELVYTNWAQVSTVRAPWDAVPAQVVGT
jgi:acyl-CoA synthetase (AMP-forming)/AMP-acid ligase II